MVYSLFQVDLGIAAKSQIENIKVYSAVTMNTDNGNCRNRDVPVYAAFFFWIPLLES